MSAWSSPDIIRILAFGLVFSLKIIAHIFLWFNFLNYKFFYVIS